MTRAPFNSGHSRLAASLALCLAVSWGCSDDPVTTPEGGADPTVEVAIGAGSTAFEARSAAAQGPGGPAGGPLVIRGANLAYDDEAGALVVDLTLINAGEVGLPEPIALVFTDLLPDGVGVLDADNEETGPGAKIFFEFGDDDAMWSPGEESVARTIAFDVGPGVGIAFAARVEAGMPEGGGRIGGIVWHDADENGERDEGEAGIEGVTLVLAMGDGPKMNAVTDPDGMYVFEGLAAGTYTVTKAPRDDLVPTTPTSLNVLLSEVEGEVVDFLEADFGCRIIDDDGPLLEVGDFVHATGEYATDPDRVIAWGIEIDCDHDGDGPCHDDDGDDDGDDGDDGDDDGDGDDGDRDGYWALGEIRGPVTDIDVEQGMLQIMGTWFSMATGGEDDGDDGDDDPDDPDDPDEGDRTAHDGDCGDWYLDLEDVSIGDRVRARVTPTDAASPDEPHVIVRLKCWNGEREKVRGWIEMIEENDDGDIVAIRILHTLVEVTPDTHIGYDD